MFLFFNVSINIDFQAYERSAGFSVYTYIPKAFHPLHDPKHLVYHQDPTSGCPTSVMNVTVNNVTQGIAFINTRPPGYASSCQNDNMNYTGIEICNVKVMGQFSINVKILIFRFFKIRFILKMCLIYIFMYIYIYIYIHMYIYMYMMQKQ